MPLLVPVDLVLAQNVSRRFRMIRMNTSVASIMPARLGPTTREKFGAIVLRAAALRVRRGPTSSMSND